MVTKLQSSWIGDKKKNARSNQLVTESSFFESALSSSSVVSHCLVVFGIVWLCGKNAHQNSELVGRRQEEKCSNQLVTESSFSKSAHSSKGIVASVHLIVQSYMDAKSTSD